jgi:hypothetical protein
MALEFPMGRARGVEAETKVRHHRNHNAEHHGQAILEPERSGPEKGDDAGQDGVDDPHHRRSSDIAEQRWAAFQTRSTTGSNTSAKAVKPAPNRDVCATRASAITLADSTERNICARANDSLQVWDRVASRLQCSVDRICTRSAADTSPRGVPGSGSAPLTGVSNRAFCASGSMASLLPRR